MTSNSVKNFCINTGLALVLGLMAWLSVQLIQDLRTHQRLAQDLAELRDVKYGMLNADVWAKQVSVIVQKKIKAVDIHGSNRANMKRALERILDKVITEADRQVRKQHRKGDWWDRTTGKIKEGMRNALVDIDTVKAGIPAYAEEILDELEKPETRAEINSFLSGMVTELTASTFSQIDDSERQAIYARYGCEKTSDCKKIIKAKISEADEQGTQLAAVTLLCAVVILFLAWLTASPTNRLPLVLLAGATLLLLLCGVLTPMMEVEAQIGELSFMFLGEPVKFYNEVLYYQSKSVLDVVAILTAKREIDMMLVGILIMTFSVIFPALKLITSMLYIYSVRSRQSKIIEFFALKSSKWSMADVMVVAIFMAYVGFNGMIGSQMALIAEGGMAQGVEALTTEGTSLQIGFFMFLAFCMVSLPAASLVGVVVAKEQGEDAKQVS